MLIHKKLSTQTNPFYEIVGELSKDEWTPVTIAYLEKIAKLVNVNNKLVETYGQAFEVLEFLRDGGAVELQLLKGTTNIYKIRRGY
jgi:hypothetical protein